jgi:hypothetical protein
VERRDFLKTLMVTSYGLALGLSLGNEADVVVPEDAILTRCMARDFDPVTNRVLLELREETDGEPVPGRPYMSGNVVVDLTRAGVTLDQLPEPGSLFWIHRAPIGLGGFIRGGRRA